MEKETRVNKYKELRKEMKDEVAINHNIEEVIEDEEDDFLSFIPKVKKKKIEDTLMEPLSYETLDENDAVRQALNEAKMNVGKEKYNTRLDILNKIRQDRKEPAHEYHEYHDFDEEVKGEEVVEEVKEEVKVEEPKQKTSLLEKLAAMSPEEDVKELEAFEEEMSIDELLKQDKKEKQEVQETILNEKPIQEEMLVFQESVVEEEVENTQEQDEKGSKLITVLNYIIVLFMIVFIVLVGFVAYELFF